MNTSHDSDNGVPDLSGLVFRSVKSDKELAALLECRWKGYRRYGFTGPDACRDAYDERAIQYVCIEDATSRLVGCLRLIPAHQRPFELEEYFDISQWANNGIRPAELTRFSVPVSKRLTAIKLGLWKLAWMDAVKSGHSHFLICTAEYTKGMYETLGFVPYPSSSSAFLHTTLRSTPHVVMIFDLTTAPELYRQTRPSLHEFFCELSHPNIFPSVGTP